MAAFADYILYFDESGSAELGRVDPDYPVFVLTCIMVEKTAYMHQVVPMVQKLKFDFVGHDQLILHEIDIRKQDEGFLFLRRNPDTRRKFLDRIGELVETANVEVIAAVIRKDKLKQRYATPMNPYDLAVQFCLEIAANRLTELGQNGRDVVAVFERRGKREADQLELAFRRIVAGNTALRTYEQFARRVASLANFTWIPQFVSKKANSSGLQLADLMARPIGLGILRPDQPNRAYDTIKTKIGKGQLKCFP
jgi:Protein of unknown function (DUF3800)